MLFYFGFQESYFSLLKEQIQSNFILRILSMNIKPSIEVKSPWHGCDDARGTS